MSTQPVTSTTQSSLHIETTDLLYLLDLVKNELKTEINCHTIGNIQTFDPITQTCTVSINYQKVLRKRNASSAAPNTYTDIVIPYPTLIRVPIVIMGGGGSYITFPISGITYNQDGSVNYPGDTCLVLFCDRDIDLWLENGNITSPPNSGRLHDISDAVAVVGLNPVTTPIQNYNTKEINIVDSSGPRLPPSGGMMVWPGITAPLGWLLCQGQSLSTTQYPFIFAVIGYTYGGSGNSFSLPNMPGNVPVGLLSGDPNFGTLGGQLGETEHQLIIDEIPDTVLGWDTFTVDQLVGGNGAVVGTSDPIAGGNLPHNNIQPSIVINWIIKI